MPDNRFLVTIVVTIVASVIAIYVYNAIQKGRAEDEEARQNTEALQQQITALQNQPKTVVYDYPYVGYGWNPYMIAPFMRGGRGRRPRRHH